MSKRASNEIADSLHGLVFETLIAELKRYREPQYDENGKRLPPQPIPPAFLAQCLKALKDNGIDSPVRAQQLKDALADEMPELDEVEEEHPLQ